MLGSRFIFTLAGQAIRLRRQCQLLASGASVRERLAALLMELGQRCGHELASGGKQIAMKLSCELLGEMLGAHRTTVNLELIELERRKLIARMSRQIIIVDEAGLRRLTESLF